MAIELSCSDLDIKGCDHVFRGETSGEVVDQVRDHLASHHDIDLPETDVVLMTGASPGVTQATDAILGAGFDEKTALVVRRLREELNVGSAPKQPPA